VGASASALPVSLAVEPGAEQSCWVQIRNTGEIVDEFVFEVLGEAARWAELDPPALSLFPGAEGELKLTFRAPRVPTTPAGAMPFGLKVTSKQNPSDAVVEEGALEIAPFEDTNAELTPRTSRGRLVGKHELAFDNRGNTPVNSQIEGLDPDDLLTFSFKPPAIVATPGTATFAKVRARPRKRFLRGAPKTIPFQVLVAPEGGEPRVVDGAVVQEPLIPRWALPALLALGALAVLWAVLLKPQIESTAKDAVKQPLAAQQKEVDAATQQAAAAQQTADAAQQQAQAAQQQADEAGSTASRANANAGKATGTANTSSKLVADATNKGTPSDGRLQVDCPPTCTSEFVVKPNQTFSLTDLVLGNPAGDSGTLTLLRDTDPVLVESMDNFRDLDFHFIAPVILSGGQKLVLDVKCRNAERAATSEQAAKPQPCSGAVYFSGFTKTKKSSAGP
jgi:hypothetical protein